MTVALWLCSYIAFSIIIPDWDISSQATLLLSFVTPCGFGLMVHELVFARSILERSNAELVVAHARLQEYSVQVEELSATRERNRIAREIHDTLGHALTLLSVQLETATQLEMRHDPRLHEELLQARQVAKTCLTEVRHSVEALRPDEAATGTLQEQLRKLSAEFEIACHHQTSIALDLEESPLPLSTELRMTLYRCAQEALTNIRKHAHATKVLLRLSKGGDQKDTIELTVLDNGGGDASEHKRAAGFGLRGMRERAELLHGVLRAGPEPKQGWRVEMILPLRQRESPASMLMTSDESGKKI
jgi:signal transduction histidine kinase